MHPLQYVASLLWSLLLVFPLLAQQDEDVPYFVSPMEGRFGQDFFIVHYVDWSVAGIRDYQCGKKTYDGHQGTDFILKSFARMDSGVYVRAVRAGKVIAVVDSLFDRNKRQNTGQLGNFVAIAHEERLFTYYAHLRKNSARVKVGDRVAAGDRLGLVGSSGNSTDPHLHFELWYDSTTLIDPFGGGDCGNPFNYFGEQFPYDSSLRLYDSGLLGFRPTLDTLRERPAHKNTFTADQDSLIAFWAHLQGVRAGDELRADWYDASLRLHSSFSYVRDSAHWYYYWWTFIPLPSVTQEEDWKVVFSVNDSTLKTQTFTLKPVIPTGLDAPSSEEHWRSWVSKSTLFLQAPQPEAIEQLEVFTISGTKVAAAIPVPYSDSVWRARLPRPLAPGVYVAVWHTPGRVFRCKFVAE